MKKVLFISLFVLGLIIPNIDVKAVDVSNEEELRAAIEQGGDITLTQNIEIKEPLVIDKDVNISNKSILMQGDNTLMTINSGNVTLNVDLYAGWNGKHDEWGFPENDVVKNQGTALVVNGGTVNTVNFDSYVNINAGNIGVEVNGGTVNFDGYVKINAGNIGLEVNGGTVTGSSEIYAGEYNENNYTYSGGQGMIVNSGNVDLGSPYIESGGIALTVNNGANVTLDGALINSYEENGIEVNDGSVVNVILTNESSNTYINSYERNGIEVNDGSVVNINSTKGTTPIFGSTNAIYLNGGSINLNGSIGLSSSTEGKGIYINKGVNTVTGGEVLVLGKNFVFGYEKGTTPNFSIYVNPDIKELRVTDEKRFMEYLNNNLNLEFCSDTYLEAESQTEEERKAICTNLNSNYDGPIESNELGKCTTVYINGVKQNEPDSSCNPVIDNENTENNNQSPQIVEVPSTSAYGSIIIIVLGIICVIVSVFVMRRVTKKTN